MTAVAAANARFLCVDCGLDLDERVAHPDQTSHGLAGHRVQFIPLASRMGAGAWARQAPEGTWSQGVVPEAGVLHTGGMTQTGTATNLSTDAARALSFWKGALPGSFARRQGVQVVAVAKHLGTAKGARVADVKGAKIAMRELLAAGLIEPGTSRGSYRATAAGLACE